MNNAYIPATSAPARSLTTLTGPLVKRLPVNLLGRDFVVGDLHGAFFLLECAMEAVEFDPSVDRLLSVGDLVDRGADSARALDYLQQPFFHAVCGNHDYRLATMPTKSVPLMAHATHAGLGWAVDLPEAQIAGIQAALRKCPLVMEVETQSGMVGLVHADVPLRMGWDEFVLSILVGDAATRDTALAGRARARDASAPGVLGIDRVFVGHTTMLAGPVRRGNVWLLDTGAIFRQDGIKTHDGSRTKGAITLVNAMTSVADFDGLRGNDGPVLVADCPRQPDPHQAAVCA